MPIDYFENFWYKETLCYSIELVLLVKVLFYLNIDKYVDQQTAFVVRFCPESLVLCLFRSVFVSAI
jgi:hypothetical protein